VKLVVFTPEERLFDADVVKVIAEATNGSFGMLERHVDIVAPLTPGILTFEDTEGTIGYFGVDEGILVKCGEEVSVAVRRATFGRDLAELRRIVKEEFQAFDAAERAARGALARLEAGVMRRMLELERSV
jgi:F-type H+-transporting ATPase subunit epsilon